MNSMREKRKKNRRHHSYIIIIIINIIISLSLCFFPHCLALPPSLTLLSLTFPLSLSPSHLFLDLPPFSYSFPPSQ